MRKATYTVPKAGSDAEDGELGVFFFGAGQGGSIDANVERWLHQFKDVAPSAVKRSDRHVAGLHQHVVEVQEGNYASGMPGQAVAPKPGFALLSAIVEAPNGNWFFKLTGPKATVQAARAPFFALLDSVRAP
jgi:hypothetical protein